MAAANDVVTASTTDPTQASSWQWRGNPVRLADNAHPSHADQPWMLVNRYSETASEDNVHSASDDCGVNPIKRPSGDLQGRDTPELHPGHEPVPGAAQMGPNPVLRPAKDPPARGPEVCGSPLVGGSVDVTGAQGPVIVGDPGDANCAVNHLGGALLLTNNTSVWRRSATQLAT